MFYKMFESYQRDICSYNTNVMIYFFYYSNFFFGIFKLQVLKMSKIWA